MPIEKDMALTPTELFATLPRALAGWTARRIDADTVVAERDGSRITVRAVSLEPRRIGPTLVLPRSLVTLDLADLDPPQREQFLTRFAVTFQRGGG